MSIERIIFRISRFTLIGYLAMILFSNMGKAQQDSAEKIVIFPPPPDTARVQYLMSISTSTDIVGRPSFFKRYVFGGEPERSIIKPYGISLHQGKLYICDTVLPGLEIIDFNSKTFNYFIPTGLGQLQKPINCALDNENRLYVADAGRQQVVVFDDNGNYLSAVSFGNPSKPTDIKVYQDLLWICDLGTHQIRVVDLKTYKELRTFPDPIPDNPEYLFSPTNIAVANGKVYVSDTGSATVKVFTVDGQFLGLVGSLGNRPGQFVRPKGVDVDAHGNLFVVDAAFENIQIFDSTSRLLMFFGGHSEQPGYLWLPAGIFIDTENLDYFQKYVYSDFNLKYLIFVSNQFGPAKINVYGFIESKQQTK
jgi:DNA-binding beta-propeller fold protein YncE